MDNSTNELGFKIERKTGAGGVYSQIASVNFGVTNFSSTNLTANTEYFYRVRAYHDSGNSPFSSEASATTLSNAPPEFTAITNRTVNVGQIVAFTASATDTDQPPQTLTFTLLAGPTNATLNSGGAFSWRPWVTDADTTNAITVKVSDNGIPSLSATQSFFVMVNPLARPALSSVALNNNQINFSVDGDVGPDYSVEVSTNLVDWTTLFTTNSPPMPFQWMDENPAVLPLQFYRIKVGPPLP
jgi:hypothetical protein